MSTQDIVEVLGGSPVVGPVRSSFEMAQVLRQGLPFASFEALTSGLSVSQGDLARALMIQPRTLTRRKHQGRLQADESDRLFRLARVFAHAIEVFGDSGKASRWLERPNRALGDTSPFEYLDTDAGAQEVDEVLGRIEHGIFG